MFASELFVEHGYCSSDIIEFEKNLDWSATNAIDVLEAFSDVAAFPVLLIFYNGKFAMY